MDSLWLENHPKTTSDQTGRDQFSPGSSYDTVVAGAGITGLTTALLLARSGAKVLVLEARHVGAGTTGHTTAKLSLLQGTMLSALRRTYSPKQVRAYVDANRAGQYWLLEYLTERGVPFQYRDAYTFATSAEGAGTLRREAEVSREAGLPVEETEIQERGGIGLPFDVEAALRLPDQAQFNPMDVLTALAEDVRAAGGSIVEGVRLMDVRDGSPVTVVTRRGEVTAGTVVLATGTPVLDRGLYFAKLRPNRSYAAALRLPAGVSMPRGLYLSAEAPTRSLRDYPLPRAGGGAGGDTEAIGDIHESAGRALLLVGGFGHPGGRSPSPRARLGELLGWAQSQFPGAEVTHTWSAQDYQATNMMPFFGRFPRGHGRIFFGTGYNKWGMANSVAAALDIAADIGGQEHPEWARTIHHRVTGPRGAIDTVSSNVDIALQNVRDNAALKGKAEITEDTTPPEGSGVTGLFHGKPAAVSTVDGTTCRLSAKCAHLGGILHWNDAEMSWDCPLHGSRFSADGKLLEGPATHNLNKLQ
ncbi:FAD-dependent oxidoreductase [Arthrobacter sp. SW1]|uniref:FAD-dependent oxidoreductase n=1 Tax=Arthrobacter sp. SW1 TaxID=1920889 RepID=UPI000877CEB6|nr:FAD-dependent oxidoreductase [Arthrobacter sp. SW1]OFI37301.1 FAD-dependent oxidoreductase [Arthrobacter sp. SW1]